MKKNLIQYLKENLCEGEDKIKELEKKIDKVEDKAEDAEKKADDAEKEADKAGESIKSEEDFKKYAENKFKEVFGEDLDKDKMNSVVNGILKKYKEDADKGDWGKLVGVLNKSFGK